MKINFWSIAVIAATVILSVRFSDQLRAELSKIPLVNKLIMR